MKLNQLVGSVQALKELSSLKLPAMLAFKISKVMNEVDEHLKVFESTRTKKLEELGVKEMKKEKGEDNEKFTGRYTFKGNNAEKFQKEMEELLNQEVEIKIPEIKIENFKDSDSKELEISAQMLSTLGWLIQ